MLSAVRFWYNGIGPFATIGETSTVIGLPRAVCLPVLICLALNACASYQIPTPGFDSGPIHVKDKFKPEPVQPVDARHPVYVWVKGYRDARKNAPSRQIGDIRDTHVSDLHSDKIVIDEDVAALVTAAMKRQLSAGGYRVVGDGDPHTGKAAFVLTGTVKRFRYDVHSRDEVDMQVQSTLRPADDQRPIWSGTVTERSQRFAGVMGDNRAAIVHFLDKGLRNVTRKTLMAVTGALAQAHPDLFLQTGTPVPGVTVQAGPEPGKAPPAAGSAAGGRGVLAVATTPAAAKVYIGDVYYGTTPLKLRLAPGIYTVRLEAEGYRQVQQKVSVRPGDTTDWETTLTK